MKPEDKARLQQIERELTQLRHQQELVVAKYTKEIYSNPDYDKFDHIARKKLREADLTLRLFDDAEYVKLLNRLDDLYAERTALPDPMLDGIELDD